VQNVSQASQLGLSGAKRTGKVELLLEYLKIVCTKYWHPETNITHSDNSISNLCEIFHLSEKRKFINAFREFIDTNVRPDELKLLIQIIDSIPVSTSECERSFNATNEVVSKKRNALLVQRASSLLFISCVRPQLTVFSRTPHQLTKQPAENKSQSTMSNMWRYGMWWVPPKFFPQLRHCLYLVAFHLKFDLRWDIQQPITNIFNRNRQLQLGSGTRRLYLRSSVLSRFIV
jgi:hypothetical protein